MEHPVLIIGKSRVRVLPCYRAARATATATIRLFTVAVAHTVASPNGKYLLFSSRKNTGFFTKVSNLYYVLAEAVTRAGED